MDQETVQKIHPRQVANKASKVNLKKALAMTLAVESDAVRLNTQTFNSNRYKAVAEIGDYEALKDQARMIKEQAIENMPALIEEVTKAIEARGGHVFFARDKNEANDYIKKVCLSHEARLVVKAKSMTSEEIRLNPVLEKAGIEVAETDLAEFILQLSGEQPSHNVAPAIHRSRERISELFKAHFDTEYPLESGEDLTRFADVYTNYNNPQCGMASVKVFDQIGIPISISSVLAEGRASQSQGLIGLAAKRASNVAEYLEKFINDGKDIIVTEPSVLALFRQDYKRLIKNDPLFEKIKAHSFDPVEYIIKLFKEYDIDPKEVFNKDKFSDDKLFYHGHCQMKSIGAGFVAAGFLKGLGFDVVISTSECCGMAGSFGYKKEYYELSKRVGDDLIDQINAADFAEKKRIVLASGTSCREQIGAETDQIILHPIEFLLAILNDS